MSELIDKNGCNICVFCHKMIRLKVFKHNYKLCKSVDCECFCSKKGIKNNLLKQQVIENTTGIDNQNIINSLNCRVVPLAEWYYDNIWGD